MKLLLPSTANLAPRPLHCAATWHDPESTAIYTEGFKTIELMHYPCSRNVTWLQTNLRNDKRRSYTGDQKQIPRQLLLPGQGHEIENRITSCSVNHQTSAHSTVQSVVNSDLVEKLHYAFICNSCADQFFYSVNSYWCNNDRGQ